MYTKFKYLLPLALLATMTEVSAQVLKLAGVDYLYYPKVRLNDDGSSLQVSFQEFNSYINVPMKLKNERTFLVNGLQFSLLEATSFSDISTTEHKQKFYKISYSFMVIHRLTEKWMLISRLSPTLASDFGDKLNSDDFLMQGFLVANKQINQKLMAGGGLIYTTRLGKPMLLPGLQLKYEQSRHQFFTFLPATIEYNYRLTQEEKLWIGFKSVLNGDNFNSSIDNFSGSVQVDRLNYVVANFGPTARYRFAKIVQLEIFAGLNAMRRYHFEDAHRKLHTYSSQISSYFSVGLTIVPPTRKPAAQNQE
ncbi:hypothetical protein J2X69_000360 [Algoriphagus sp. 4150]|uniref:DUF6268 family outer membrane beta-barrel protein n=1 Tax=Algoriphagus sp. 4150 TaxID=2817756 RepID=UPI00285520A1|nr:DUF6268 family outer membrane beta-barrel protein [Algoriphagus sp. 4150]MDR7128032.1 hypothetical protein [Algoriphagus sp. 4150]